MRLLMAITADGFVSRGPRDDMSWTGPLDKRLFRILTSVGGRVYAGSTTYELMRGSRHVPAYTLEGRRLFRVTRNPTDKAVEASLADIPSDGWLIGGPTIAYAAMDALMVEEVHLNRIIDVGGFDLTCKDAQKFNMHAWTYYPKVLETKIAGGLTVVHEVYRRKDLTA